MTILKGGVDGCSYFSFISVILFPNKDHPYTVVKYNNTNMWFDFFYRYCDCFANGEFCHNCNCTNCANNLVHEEERSRAIKSCLDRNPMAFHPKIGINENVIVIYFIIHCLPFSCLGSHFLLNSTPVSYNQRLQDWYLLFLC